MAGVCGDRARAQLRPSTARLRARGPLRERDCAPLPHELPHDLVHVARALKADTAQWLGHATSLQVLTWRRCEHASPTCSAGCVMLLARPVVPAPQVVQHSLPEHWGLPWLKRRCAWSACSFASLSCPAHKPCKWVARCAGLATGKFHSTLRRSPALQARWLGAHGAAIASISSEGAVGVRDSKVQKNSAAL